MKIITLEEHFQLAEITEAVARFLPRSQESFYDSPTAQLEDLGVSRLQAMEASVYIPRFCGRFLYNSAGGRAA